MDRRFGMRSNIEGLRLSKTFPVSGVTSNTAADANPDRVELQVDGGAPVTVAGFANWTHDYAGIGEGPHLIAATALDTSNNDNSVTVSIEVDTTDPHATIRR